jgi:hypothetical protein
VDNCLATGGICFQFPEPEIAVLRRLALCDPLLGASGSVINFFLTLQLILGCFGDTLISFWNSLIYE